ncbi:MAG: HAMP domain-containing protein [Chloracidobacterium sp.]|nr:HAMP domain-containing protein [Chloracidobacterium sp.]MCO5333540.1 ATP-binding protein [Pyrinomonadaceae bacterium]
MKLFVKIFLWFLIAIALMFGVIYSVTNTFQTEPLVNRFERSTRNQMIVYAETVTQIASYGDEQGVRAFLARLRDREPPRVVNLVGDDGFVWFGDTAAAAVSAPVIEKTRQTGLAETDFSDEEHSIAAAPVRFPDGRRFTLAIQWERSAPPPLFFGTGIALARFIIFLLTSVLVCYLLALYLTSPIRKLRFAARRLAGGDLSTRVASQVGHRRDELADLARDFDLMAERIETLVTTQQRLNRDISHELRSPLARMNVALELAKQKQGDNTLLLERIEGESARLNEMIESILTLAKLESGSENYEKRRIDLDELVRDVAMDAQFEAEANRKNVELKGVDPCTVMGSENLLRSAVENIIRNAVRYTKERTSVEVSLRRSNGHAVVAISDHGGGVPDGEIENLFRPFYRVGEDRTRKTGGIGLGLAIAERAVSAHKGTIKAANKNGGLEVEITLDAV